MILYYVIYFGFLITLLDGIWKYAFCSCNSLTSVVISNSVTSIGDRAFEFCDLLTCITIPDSVTSIGKWAFSRCDSLTSVTIGNSVTSIGWEAFGYCYSLIEVCNKSSLNVTAGSENNGYVGCYAKHIITDKSQSYLKYLGDYVFYDDGTKIYLVKYIGSDTEITLPEYDGGKDYEIYKYAFYSCISFTSIVIPDFVTSIGEGAFMGCWITSVTIGNSVTRIGNEAFRYCYSLTTINFNGTIAKWIAVSKGSEWNDPTGLYTIYCTNGTIAKNGTVTYK